MSLLEQLTDDMKTAMKAGDKARLSALRMMISAIRYVGIDSGEMTDEKVVAVLQKEAKKRRESIAAFTAGGRLDAAETEKQELKVIEAYLPQMMSDEAVRQKVTEILEAQTFPNLGAAIGAVMSELKGMADGGTVSRIVKASYSQPE
jgi:uncharacterized protein